MEHKGTVRLETDRLVLRRAELSDVEYAYNNWCSEDVVTKYLRWPTHPNKDVTEYVIKSWIEEYGKPDFYQWMIELKELGEPVGTIAVVELNEKAEKVHIGYCIGSKWWHQGIMSEAFSRVIDFFFDEVKANRVEAQHDPNNPNSGKVMLKCGLKYEGTLRQNDWNNQGIVDASMYAILRDEWLKTR